MLLEIDENASPFLKMAMFISGEVIRKNASEAVIEAAAGKMSVKRPQTTVVLAVYPVRK